MISPSASSWHDEGNTENIWLCLGDSGAVMIDLWGEAADLADHPVDMEFRRLWQLYLVTPHLPNRVRKARILLGSAVVYSAATCGKSHDALKPCSRSIMSLTWCRGRFCALYSSKICARYFSQFFVILDLSWEV